MNERRFFVYLAANVAFLVANGASSLGSEWILCGFCLSSITGFWLYFVGLAEDARCPRPDTPAKIEEAAKSVPKKTRAPNGTFDRTAYQREYMRRRRAK